jgi:hypothetical protein
MNFSQTKDERLLAFYENIRRQVHLDMQAGGRYRLIGEGVKQYADKLRDEMDQRRLRFTPIDWQRWRVHELVVKPTVLPTVKTFWIVRI